MLRLNRNWKGNYYLMELGVMELPTSPAYFTVPVTSCVLRVAS
jgi:hypothetical protein